MTSWFFLEGFCLILPSFHTMDLYIKQRHFLSTIFGLWVHHIPVVALELALPQMLSHFAPLPM